MEKEDVDSRNHVHWCVYTEGDDLLQVEPVPHEIQGLEDAVRGYLRDLAGLMVIDTLADSHVT